MKLRYIYGLLGGLLGIILAYAFTTFLIAFLGGLFWMYVFGDNTWPSWTGALMITMGTLSFLGTFAASVLYGYKHGLKLENNPDQSTCTSKALGHLLIGLLVLIAAVGYISYRYNFSKSALLKQTNDIKLEGKIVEDLKSISSIEINQIEKGIDVVGVIDGATQDKYDLMLQLTAKGYVQEMILEEAQPIELKFSQQSFHFEIPFEELSQRYRKILEGYVLNFDQHFAIDEVIEVVLKLKLKETTKYDAKKVEALNIPSQDSTTLLRLSFDCFQNQCEIQQKDESNPSSQQ